MARELSLEIKIKADAAQAKRELATVEGSLEKVETGARNVGTSFDTAAKTAVAAFSGAAILATMKRLEDFTRNAVGSFAAAQRAQVELVQTLTHFDAAALAKPYEDVATAVQRITTVSDETVLGIESRLLPLIGVKTPEEMQKAVLAVLDLSQGLGMSVDASTLAIAKAVEGHGETLARFGIKIDKSKDQTQQFDDVVAAISSRFGGQAAAQLDTYTGKLENFHNRLDDLHERLGEVTLRGLDPLIRAFEGLPEPVQLAGGAALELARVFGPGIAGGLGLYATLHTSLIPTLLETLPAAFGAVTGFISGTVIPMISGALVGAFETLLPFLGPIGWIAAAVAAVLVVWKHWDQIVPIVKSVYEGVKLWLVDKFAAIVDTVKSKVDAVTGFFRDMADKVVLHSYVPDMVRGIGSEFGKLDANMVAPASAATSAVEGLFSGMLTNISGGLTGWAGSFLPSWLSGVSRLIDQGVSGMLAKATSSLSHIFGGGIVGGVLGGGLVGGAIELGKFIIGGLHQPGVDDVMGGGGLSIGQNIRNFNASHTQEELEKMRYDQLVEEAAQNDRLGGITGMAAGGFGHASGPRLFYTAGNEDFAFSGEGKRFGGGGGPTVIVNVAGSVQSERDLVYTISRALADQLRSRRSVGLA